MAESNGTVFPASSGAFTLPAAFTAATVIEIGVLHLLIPWAWLRWVLDAVSVVSIAALFAVVAKDARNPHRLVDGRLVLHRFGKEVAGIPVTEISGVGGGRRYSPTEPEVADGELCLPNQDGTNVEILLRRPRTVTLAGLAGRPGRSGDITRVRLYVDEPQRFVDTIRRACAVE
ncbi:hypothetical protein [Nocardia brevicatena]|uniref:hypothetical protein n=1 Tax=Nocardia brevicatena TaxID=37327 RepID=UPI00030796F0|nr:hypothetical protein [Nocardia brevicatena]